MPFQTTDFEDKRQQMTAFAANRAPELASSPLDWLGEQIGAEAQIQQSLERSVGLAAADAVPTSEMSSNGLDTWATALGLDDGKAQGTYGRKGATPATGAQGQISGTSSTLVLGGTQAVGPSGVLLRLRNKVTLPGLPPGTGQTVGIFDIDPQNDSSLGPVGNLTAGAVLSWISPPAGLDPTVTLITPMQVLGLPKESDPDLLKRIQQKMQLPPKGGAAQDYGDWVENAKTPQGQPLGISVTAWRYPNYDGDGCPVVVVTLPGSGLTRIPASRVLSNIQLYVEGSTSQVGQRPLSHSFRAIPPFMPLTRQLILRARTIPSKAAYHFDWKRGLNIFKVAAYTVGPPDVVTLDNLAPSDLKAAIDSGLTPKIYIDTRDAFTGLPTGNPIPIQAKVTAWVDRAGKTQLTLENPLPPGWQVPSASGVEEVFSGGPLVIPVSTSVLAKVDSLGPSKTSGFSDPNQLFMWEDTLAITGISTAIETTLDTDGLTRFVARVPANSVTIGIGLGPPLSQDVTASDNTVNGPELLWAGRILITD